MSIKNLVILLSILIVLGILWMVSGYWDFSREQYLDKEVVAKSVKSVQKLDIEYLIKEFDPAYEF